MMDLFPNAPMNKRASDKLRNLATINLFDRYTIAKSMMMSFRVGLFADSSMNQDIGHSQCNYAPIDKLRMLRQ